MISKFLFFFSFFYFLHRWQDRLRHAFETSMAGLEASSRYEESEEEVEVEVEEEEEEGRGWKNASSHSRSS